MQAERLKIVVMLCPRALKVYGCLITDDKEHLGLNMGMEPEYTPAERRREKLRQHILHVANELYLSNGGLEGGYENTTVEQIAEHSDISLRSFFRYFDSKQDVIFLDGKQALYQLERLIQFQLKSHPPMLAVFNGRLDQIRNFYSNPQSKQRAIRALTAPQFRDRLLTIRGQIEAKMASLLFQNLDGDETSRERIAQLGAGLISTLVNPLISAELLESRSDIDGDMTLALADLKLLIKKIQ